MPIRLAFGTAGIRAPLGDADDQLNLRSVRAVALALVEHLASLDPALREHGLCVAFDGRSQSDVFAAEVIGVALAHGFLVRAFELPVPTPLLAYTTRAFDAAAGVMITASHNPPTDNGLKVYWRGGAQIVPPHDREIAARISAITDVENIARVTGAAQAAHERLLRLGKPEVERYLEAICKLVERPSQAQLPRLAYTALCGVGSHVTRALLERAGAGDVHEVVAQAEPRADFGGLRSPNPEQPSALEQLVALAEREQAQLAFAHDPDADRLAVIARDSSDGSDGQGALRVLSGDEVGALLGAYMIEHASDPKNALVVSTLVSAELLRDIAHAHGARYEQTLTGFKWIATRARALEREAGLSFVFGYEEAIGYAFGALGDDKDGIAALFVLLDLVRELAAQNKTLVHQLESLARRHGLYASRQLTVSARGDDGRARMAKTIERLRALEPAALLGEGACVEDYLTRAERTDLLVFRHPDGARVCVRPSGTEPKLKLYLHARTPVDPGEAIELAQVRVEERLDALEARLASLTS